MTVFEWVDFLIYSFLGWRYLLSPEFRSHVHRHWRFQSRLSIAFEVLQGLGSMVLTLTIIFWAVRAGLLLKLE